MADVKCPHCGETYDSESRTMTIRHEHKFCLSNPTGRKKKGEAARAAAEEIAREINGGDRRDCAYPPALVALLDDCSIKNEKALADWLEGIISRHCSPAEAEGK